MLKKIVLGTANINKIYGIRKKKLNPKDIKKIFSLNKNLGNKIDTAIAYNKSFSEIKKFNSNNQKVYSKLPCIYKNKINVYNLETLISNHLKSIGQKKIFCLSFHNPKNLLYKKGEKIYKLLITLKKKKLIKHIGISVNHIKDLKVLKKFRLDLIQIPLNIFDQRFIEKKIFNILLKKKIKIQIRSIFLQGALLQKQTPRSLIIYKKIFNQFFKFCKISKMSQVYHCINFIKSIKSIDSIVIGITNFSELTEIVNVVKYKKKIFNYFQFKSKNLNLIMPPKWKK
jgi:aryl-alcohol dehydrogenase-like predicted oxidoreductase